MPGMPGASEARAPRSLSPVPADTDPSPDPEISTEDIGAYVMKELKLLDKVAFVRFASVYRNFRDIDEFKNELNDLLRTRE